MTNPKPFFPDGMTDDQVATFAKQFGKALGVKIFWKTRWLSLVKWFMALMGRTIPAAVAQALESIDAKLRPWCAKNLIFMQCRIGDGTPWKEVVCRLAHEAGHALRIRGRVEDGGTVSSWYRDYLKTDDNRATEEGLAFAIEDTVHYFLFGYFQGLPSDLAGSYLLDSKAVGTARAVYDLEIAKVKKHGRGSSTHQAAAEAICYLRAIKAGR
ncbi:hypothetical protein M0R36_10895 [bacterium]|jgi:hypothetical protein|nr:hypothetical protein [bacterium]